MSRATALAKFQELVTRQTISSLLLIVNDYSQTINPIKNSYKLLAGISVKLKLITVGILICFAVFHPPPYSQTQKKNYKIYNSIFCLYVL